MRLPASMPETGPLLAEDECDPLTLECSPIRRMRLVGCNALKALEHDPARYDPVMLQCPGLWANISDVGVLSRATVMYALGASRLRS